MMKLPYRKNAQVSKDKLLNYLLSESHPVGRSKAKFFRKLGFNERNTDKLELSFLSIAYNNDVEDIKKTSYGINYVIKGSISTNKGKKVDIKTVWFVELNKTTPRFVTAIPDIIRLRKKTQ